MSNQSNKSWRAKYYKLRLLPRRRLVITFRRFKTVKANRAQSFKQLVIPLRLVRTKEVAIKWQRLPKRRRKSVLRTQTIPLGFTILGLIGLGIFGWQTLHSNQLDSVRTFSVQAAAQPAKPAKPKSLPRSIPIRLTIPAIQIDAPIIQVDKAADGTIQTPPVLDWVTGWYQESPTPGEIGPSVIVGHVDSYKGISVFWRLRELQPNDEVDVTRQDGSVVRFRVEALYQFDQANFPTKQVYGNIDHPGLRLITCGGTFSSASGQYDHNTVVFASMIQ
jgi:sortase (surface protein transpeptidase)